MSFKNAVFLNIYFKVQVFYIINKLIHMHYRKFGKSKKEKKKTKEPKWQYLKKLSIKILSSSDFFNNI